jgi:acetyl-CoA synthetase
MASEPTPAAEHVLKPVDSPESHYLHDYETAYRSFHWEDATSDFDWARTGKVNMAYEAIDRHLTRGRRNKLALIYTDREQTIRLTFEQLGDSCRRRASCANLRD